MRLKKCKEFDKMAGQQAHPMVHFVEQENITVGTLYKYSVLTAANITELGNQMVGYARKQPGVNMLLDFSHVEYISSMVLTELLRLRKTIEMIGGNLRLCGVGPTVMEVFEITNLKGEFVIHSDGVDKDFARFQRSIELALQEAKWDDPSSR